MAADLAQPQKSTCLTRETAPMRTLSFLMITLLFFSASVAGAERQTPLRQLRFFYSNDVQGETEPCG